MATQRKDKKSVTDETFDEGMLRSFLVFTPGDNTDPDFHVLLKAYRGLTAADFASFLSIFAAENRNVNACDLHGKSLLNIISTHHNGTEYAAALRGVGAE